MAMMVALRVGLLVVVAVGLITAGVLIARRGRGGAIAVAVIGALLLGGVGYTVMAMAGVGERHETVMSFPDGGPRQVTFAIRHERLSFDGVRYEFRVDESRDELFALLRDVFPDGKVVDDAFRFDAASEHYVVAELPEVRGNAFVLDVVPTAD